MLGAATMTVEAMALSVKIGMLLLRALRVFASRTAEPRPMHPEITVPVKQKKIDQTVASLQSVETDFEEIVKICT